MTTRTPLHLLFFRGCCTVMVCLLLPAASKAQNRAADSLKKLLVKTAHDTSRLDLQNKIGLALYDDVPDSSLSWWKATIVLAGKKRGTYTGVALKRLQHAEAEALNNVAVVYSGRGMTAISLDYNFKSLRLREQLNDRHGVAESMNNIAYLYSQQQDTAQALSYYAKSAEGYAAINDLGGVAYTQINRAKIYVQQHKDSLAEPLYLQAMTTLEKMPQHHRGYSTSLASVGNICTRAGRFSEAAYYLHRSLGVRAQRKDFAGIANSYVALGKMHHVRSNMDSALFYAENAFGIAQQTKNAQAVIAGADLLSELYRTKGDFRKAYDFKNINVNTRDSVSGEEAGREILRQQLSYDYAKKSAADSLQFVREKEMDEVKLDRQRDYTKAGFTALAIVGGLLFFVYRQRNSIAREKKRSDNLLLNILPAETAEELKETGTARTKSYTMVTVMFTDFKNFTQTAEQLTPEALVELINHCYGEFDRIVSRHNVEKIKTIGDSYMCVGGLPVPNETNAVDTIRAAQEILTFINTFNAERKRQGLPFFDIRIGIHTGPVVAGIVGIKKFAYDIWGDTVNIASRMESSGEPGRINISQNTYEQVKTQFTCTHRGKIQAKNKGEIDMYFVAETQPQQAM